MTQLGGHVAHILIEFTQLDDTNSLAGIPGLQFDRKIERLAPQRGNLHAMRNRSHSGSPYHSCTKSNAAVLLCVYFSRMDCNL